VRVRVYGRTAKEADFEDSPPLPLPPLRTVKKKRRQ
jgi:hypothetical protein